jgi:hypothetical protein
MARAGMPRTDEISPTRIHVSPDGVLVAADRVEENPCDGLEKDGSD